MEENNSKPTTKKSFTREPNLDALIYSLKVLSKCKNKEVSVQAKEMLKELEEE